MIKNVAIIGQPRGAARRKQFNVKLKMILCGQHKLEIIKLPTIDKSLDKLLKEKFSFIIIHEDTVKKVKIGEQIISYKEVVYRGIVKIKTGLIKLKGKEIRSNNKDTPIIILYSDHDEDKISKYNSAGVNISINYNDERFIDILMNVIDQY